MRARICSLTLCLALLAGLVFTWTAYAAEAPADSAEIPAPQVWDDPLYWKLTAWDGAQEDAVSASIRAAGVSWYGDATPRALAAGETLQCGIDVSYFQRDIDWAAVKESGVEFVIIRGAYRTYGTAGFLYEDERFQEYVEGAKAVGLKVGAYIFSQALSEDEARQEARFLMDVSSGYSMDLPLVMDYETAGEDGRLTTALRMWMEPDQATNICNAFVDEVQKNGYAAMVYANKYMLENQLIDEDLGRIWLAHYTRRTDYAGDYEFWQFSSSGQVPGIRGSVDLDFWFNPGSQPSVPVRRSLPFRDVSQWDWFYNDVRAAYDAEIVNGTSVRYFSPYDSVSRGAVVTMLYRMAGSPAVSGSTGFRDLIQDYYRTPVLWAWKQGYVGGYSDTQFGPEDTMTRQDLAVVLYRMAGSPDVYASLGSFWDAGQIADYAVSAMRWAVAENLLRGSEGALRPRDYCSRAEACALLMRYGNI